MALHEDHDISIITHSNDVAEDSIDEADILTRHIALNSYGHPLENTESLQVFRNAYDDLKRSYNNLFTKTEQKDKRIKELEDQLNSSSSNEYSTDSFLMVDEPQIKTTEVKILQGRIKELERKLMIAEVNIKSLQAEKSHLENTLKGLKSNDQNRESLERTKIFYLEDKVKKLTERLEKFSLLDSGRDFEEQLMELKKDMEKTKEENLSLVVQLRKLTEENVTLKRKMYAKNEKSTISNGTTGVTGCVSLTGASKEVITDHLSDTSLNSSLPAMDELENLKLCIKKLKTVVETQNAYLLKLDSNPTVKKILRDEKLGLSMNPVIQPHVSSNMGSNSSVNNVGTNLSTETTDSGYLNRCSPKRALSPVGNALVIPNDTDSWLQFRKVREPKVEIPELEQYDNLELTPHRNLRQYQSKSQSEVISCTNEAAIVNNRRQSHILRSTNSAPIFSKESARVISPGSAREAYCAYDRPSNGIVSRTFVDSAAVGADGSSAKRESERISSIKTCPVCNADYTHKSVNEFQTHVFNCVDAEDQPNTLTCESVPERICPMCNHLFPESCPQLEVDNHVNAHFEEAPTDPFEILSP